MAGRRFLGRNDDAPSLAFLRRIDSITLAHRRLEGRDSQRLLVHDEVVTVEPMPLHLFTIEWRRGFNASNRSGKATRAGDRQYKGNEFGWRGLRHV